LSRPDAIDRAVAEAGGDAGCFFRGRALSPLRVCGYTAALGLESALRPNRSRRDILVNGAIAQLGERFNGIEEVVGSIPSGSTIKIKGLVKA
jgi:hypothetical protein